MFFLARLLVVILVLATLGGAAWYLIAAEEDPAFDRSLRRAEEMASFEEEVEHEEADEGEIAGETIDSLPMPAPGSEDATGPGEIHGLLRGIDGQPLPGAKVKVVSWVRRKVRGRVRSRRAGQQQAVTNREGRFFFRGLPLGRHGIDAWTRKRSIENRQYLTLSEEKQTEEIELDLVKGHALTLRFVDPDGRPVVGAAIELQCKGSKGATADPVKSRSGVTDAAGRFVGTGLRRRSRYSVKFEHADYYVPGRQRRFLVDEDREESIEAVPFATLAGRVEDPEGRPVPAAEVEITGRPLVVADDQGRFLIEDIRGREKPMRLLAATSDLLQIGREKVRVGPGEDKRGVVIRLRKAGVITGRVADVDDTPIRGATVSVSRKGIRGKGRLLAGSSNRLQMVDLGGEPVIFHGGDVNTTFRLSEVSKDGQSVFVDPVKVDGSSIWTSGEVTSTPTITFPSRVIAKQQLHEEVDRMNARMEALQARESALKALGATAGKSERILEHAAIRRALTDELASVEADLVGVSNQIDSWTVTMDGGGARIFTPTDAVASLRDRIDSGHASAQTGDDGRYFIAGLWPGEYRIRASQASFLGAKHPDPVVIPEEGGEREIDFVLNRGARIEVALTRTDGGFGGAVKLEVINQQNGAGNSTKMRWQSPMVMDGLPAGLYTIRARGGRKEELVDLVADVRLELDQVYDDISLVLAPGARIEGQVVDSDGRPVRDAMVTVHGRGRGKQSFKVKTDAAGRYDQGGLFAGTYVVEVRKKGFLTTKAATLELQHQERRLHDVELSRGLTLTGIVVDGEGNPLPKINVFVRPASNARSTKVTSTDSEGRFKVSSLPPEGYNVYARSDDRKRCARQVIELDAESARSDVRLAMAPALLIRGQLSDVAGGKISGLQVTARAVDNPNLTRRGQTKVDGSFEVPNLYPGTYRLSVNRDGKDLPEKKRRPTARVRPGGPVPSVRIVLRD